MVLQEEESFDITFSQSDPLLKLFLKLTRVHTTFMSISICWLILLPAYVTASFEGILRDPKLFPDLISDVGMYGMFFIMSPLFLAFSIKYYHKFSNTINELFIGNVFTSESASFANTTREYNGLLNKKCVTITIYIISLCIMATVIFSIDAHSPYSWHLPNGKNFPITQYLFWPAYFIANYLIIQIIIRFSLSYYILYKLFRRTKINIQMLHPDRCGGLSPIGSLAMFLNVFIFIAGLLVVVALYDTTYVYNLNTYHPLNILIVFSFLTISALTVFSPIIIAHDKMKEKKRKDLHIINSKFEKINTSIKEDLDTENINYESLSIKMDRLSIVKGIYNNINAQPVWPFNTKIILTFIGSVFSPIAFTIVDMFITSLNLFD